MSEKLTEADAKNWHMQEAVHYNGGDAFFAYLHRCIEQPRLSRFDRYDKKTRAVTSTWKIDGIDRPSFAEAIERLNAPAVFDADELAHLATLPDDYVDIRKGLDWPVARRVRDKGGSHWEDGKCRITPAGRRALSGEA